MRLSSRPAVPCCPRGDALIARSLLAALGPRYRTPQYPLGARLCERHTSARLLDQRHFDLRLLLGAEPGAKVEGREVYRRAGLYA